MCAPPPPAHTHTHARARTHTRTHALTHYRCVALVKQLKGITATYRMTTKGPPTRHSHYVTGVCVVRLEMLVMLLGEALGCPCPCLAMFFLLAHMRYSIHASKDVCAVLLVIHASKDVCAALLVITIIKWHFRTYDIVPL